MKMVNELINERDIFLTQTKYNNMKIITLPIKINKNNITNIKLNKKPINTHSILHSNKKAFPNGNNNIYSNKFYKNINTFNKKTFPPKVNIYLKKKITHKSPNCNSNRKEIPKIPIPQTMKKNYSYLSNGCSPNTSRSSSNLTQSLEFNFQRKKNSEVDLICKSNNNNNGLSFRSNGDSSLESISNRKREINFSPIKIKATVPRFYSNSKYIFKEEELIRSKIIKTCSMKNKYEISFDFPIRK
jgi:hypothetical protein